MPARVEPEMLQGVELVENLTSAQVAELIAICDEILCTAGRNLYEMGQEERALYILLDGTVEVDISSARSGARQLEQLKAGSVFGESSFFHAAPHTATVRALTDARLLRLDRDRFNELLRKDNLSALRVAANSAKILAARLQQADRFIAGLLDANAGEKINEALARFRETMSHSFHSGAGASVGPGSVR
jgi:CRP-like cAMP-binding protein